MWLRKLARPAAAVTAASRRALGQERWRDLLACVALVGWVFFIYRDSFGVYFLGEDFTWLRHCSVGPLRALTALVRPDANTEVYSWRPVAQLWIGLHYIISQFDPVGYRVAILACQASAACAVYGIGMRAADRFTGLVAAVVFATHPLHVESLSWTCTCASAIASTLNLLALLAFFRWRDHGSASLLVLPPYALALLTQESAVALPGLVAAADLLLPSDRRSLKARVQLYIGLVAVTIGFVVLRRLSSPASFSFTMVGLDPRLPISALGLVRFIVGKASVSAAMVLTLPANTQWLALPCTALITLAAVILWWQRQPIALLGLLWLAIALAPYSLLLFGPFARYMHLPLAGFGMTFAGLISAAGRWLHRRNRYVATGTIAVALIGWLSCIVPQIDHMQSEFIVRGNLTRDLLLDLLRVLPHPRPGSTLAFYGLGELRGGRGVLVYGLDDAARLFYGDDSLKVVFGRPRGAGGYAYQLAYQSGRLYLVGSGLR